MQPVCRHVSDLLKAVEHIAVQHLGAVGLVESFDVGVLGRFSWLDVVEGNALGLGPLGPRMGNEFRSVVNAEWLSAI